MNSQTALLLFVLLLAACSSAPQSTETNHKSPDSGIEGTVTMGPVCPVVQENVPCPDQPFQGIFTVLTTSGSQIAEFTTNEQGNFRVGLASGDYVLHLESPNPMRIAKDIPFNVEENKYTLLNITLDSGIR
ncbi:MAG: hypothetical protein HY864_05380 [Chloroflexi bacterium]|nr:hypothetical protein [Chloroflexota bacterium]